MSIIDGYDNYNNYYVHFTSPFSLSQRSMRKLGALSLLFAVLFFFFFSCERFRTLHSPFHVIRLVYTTLGMIRENASEKKKIAQMTGVRVFSNRPVLCPLSSTRENTLRCTSLTKTLGLRFTSHSCFEQL